jgi:thiol:disulfide interchange protein
VEVKYFINDELVSRETIIYSEPNIAVISTYESDNTYKTETLEINYITRDKTTNVVNKISNDDEAKIIKKEFIIDNSAVILYSKEGFTYADREMQVSIETKSVKNNDGSITTTEEKLFNIYGKLDSNNYKKKEKFKYDSKGNWVEKTSCTVKSQFGTDVDFCYETKKRSIKYKKRT